MELKVWVEGIQRIVCGVTEKTTCQDVVYALAHATGKTGRFTLIERWRNNERLLAPNENPLKVLMKWGEYSNDVQFILQRSPLDGSSRVSHSPLQKTSRPDQHLQGFSPPPPFLSENKSSSPKKSSPHPNPPPPTQQGKDIKKSLTFSGGHHSNSPFRERGEKVKRDNVGIVKGIPQRQNVQNVPPSVSPSLKNDAVRSSPSQVANSVNNNNNNNTGSSKGKPPPYREPPRPNSPNSPISAEKKRDQVSPEKSREGRQKELPPYREPPPPTTKNSHLLYHMSPTSSSASSPAPSSSHSPNSRESPGKSEQGWAKSPKPKRNLFKEFRSPASGDSDSQSSSIASTAIAAQETSSPQYETQCRELIKLIKHQQNKLTSQQTELVKYDAEIMYLEGKAQEQQQKMEYIAKEMVQLEIAGRQNEEKTRIFIHVEEEQEIVKQQEKTLKSEITLLRSKVSNCETELLQCKNKIRLLLDDLQNEQRQQSREDEDRKQREMNLLNELERLQRELDQTKKESELACEANEKLDREVKCLESSITEKKEQVEKLVQEMKEANLQSLSIAPAEDLRFLLEGPHKSGSARKMIGSPRQLENAVPTSKNPHGVWV